jgi:hypothetical protein
MRNLFIGAFSIERAISATETERYLFIKSLYNYHITKSV